MHSLEKEFDKISISIWDSIYDAWMLNANLGENTISDLILLYLKKLKRNDIDIIPHNQRFEKKSGADWFWVIGSSRYGKWISFAVQAKRINEKEEYSEFAKVSKAKTQTQNLIKFSKRNNALAVYALYNNAKLNKKDTNNHLHCGCRNNFLKQTFLFQSKLNLNNLKPLKIIKLAKQKNLGVSIVPANTIHTQLSRRMKRNFKSIHQVKSSIPLKCLICELSCKLNNCVSNGSKTIDILGEKLLIENTNQMRLKISQMQNDGNKIDESFDSQFFEENNIDDLKFYFAKRMIIIDVGVNDDPK